ncbi:MAG TPA: glycosyltransferase family 4 protein [Pontiella sp.]|nr:glycosyltransferase family 4 protein [Pontiella sp.]
MNDKPKLQLVMVGQTPPPFNGQAKMIEVLLKGLSDRYDTRFVRMQFSDSVSMAGKFAPGKIIHLFALVFRAWKALGVKRDRYLYYPPASPNLIPILRDILFLMAVRPFSKGLILHFHAGGVSRYAQRHPLLRQLLRLAYGRMSLGIVQGASCPDDPGFFHAKAKAVVPHGIDVKGRASDSEGKSDGRLHILYVGIHTRDKGLFTLLDTAKELVDRKVDFAIHTVGRWYTRKEEERFLQTVKQQCLQDYIFCRGEQIGDELEQAYAWADVFLFPTRYPWETMGIVQLEAMAHGLPVVATDWQGPRDVVIDRQTGFLCRPDHACDFADRIQQLAIDPGLRKAMGTAAQKKYQSFYTADAYMRRMNAVLEQLA